MKNEAKVLEKLMNQLGERTLIDYLMPQYQRDFHVKNQPKPKGVDNYIGIEIECFGPLKVTDVFKLLLSHDLEKYINIGYDGSIEQPMNMHSHEFRILSKEKELADLLPRLSKFLKEGKFKVNKTCGLHVHLDMRNRDFEKCYAKLVKFQDVLFGMVKANRWESEYCQWSGALTRLERFTAINRQAYDRHKTIEVRLHHGSVDVVKIENWINLLLRAIKGKELPAVQSKADILKWVGPDKKLKSYINKGFHKSWFTKKAKVMLGYQDPDDYDEGYF